MNRDDPPEKLRNYEPLEIDIPGMDFAPVVAFLFKEDNGERELHLRVDAPGESPQDLEGRALRTYQVMRRAEAWVSRPGGIVDRNLATEKATGWEHLRSLYENVALIALGNLQRIYAARIEQDTPEAEAEQKHLAALQESLGLTGEDFNAWLHKQTSSNVSRLFASWIDEGKPEELESDAHDFLLFAWKHLAADAILQTEEELPGVDTHSGKWGKAFQKHFHTVSSSRAGTVTWARAQELAEDFLTTYDAAAAPLEQLRVLLGFILPQEQQEALAAVPGMLKIPTGQIMNHIYAHVVSPELMTHAEMTYYPGKKQPPVTIRAISQTDATMTLTSPADELLEQIHKSILSVKKHGAALLKVQLDLMSQAYAAGGTIPVFHYSLSDALERQGYAQRDARGYDHETMQGLRQRVATLTHQSIDVLNLTETNKKGKPTRYIESTPYWIVESTRRRTEGEEVNHGIVLLDDPSMPIITGFTMRPGLWWAFAGISHFHLHIPTSILELPTHGRSHEVERLALQLTPLLAIWERSSQQQHAGQNVHYGAGKLLTEAGYTTQEEFMAMHPTAAQRIRDYLASTEGTGAIPLLNRLGAFVLDIKDDADYFASGRGWRERFWNAQVRVSVRNLQLPKEQKQGRRARK